MEQLALLDRAAFKPAPVVRDPRPWGVQVNEVAIFASQQGVDWWMWFTMAHRHGGRIALEDICLGGGVWHVECESKHDSTWLAGHMVSFGGVPQRAVKVRRRAAEVIT